MRTRLALDHALLAKAQAATGLKDKSSVIREVSRPSSSGKARGAWRASAVASLA